MAPGRRSHLDVEVGHTLDKRHIAVVRIGKQLGHAGAVRVIDALEHLERALGVAAHGTQHGRGLNTVHTARVGHGHALDVLDDVARAGNIHMIGFATERLGSPAPLHKQRQWARCSRVHKQVRGSKHRKTRHHEGNRQA